MAVSNVIVGSKVVAYVNGLVYGRTTALSIDSETPRKEIMTVDVQWAQELAATTVHTRGNLTVLRLSGDGGAQGAKVSAPQTQISNEKYFHLLVVDRTTGVTLFESANCQCNSESWSVDARGRMEGRISFSAILWNNSDS